MSVTSGHNPPKIARRGYYPQTVRSRPHWNRGASSPYRLGHRLKAYHPSPLCNRGAISPNRLGRIITWRSRFEEQETRLKLQIQLA